MNEQKHETCPNPGCENGAVDSGGVTPFGTGIIIRCETCKGTGKLTDEPPRETCQICKWSNVSLLNLGEFGPSIWVCHGCCKRMLEALKRISDYPVHSEPVGGAMAMQDIACVSLSPSKYCYNQSCEPKPIK